MTQEHDSHEESQSIQRFGCWNMVLLECFEGCDNLCHVTTEVSSGRRLLEERPGTAI